MQNSTKIDQNVIIRKNRNVKRTKHQKCKQVPTILKVTNNAKINKDGKQYQNTSKCNNTKKLKKT